MLNLKILKSLKNKNMKSRLTILYALCFAAIINAQVPEKMSYQAVVRNSKNELVKNTQVGMRISILQGSIAGAVVYTETQNPTTNDNGLISIQFGGGNGFDAIDWSQDSYFLKTETDINGGTNYSIEGVSQLLSVPYALYAKVSGSSTPGPKGDTGSIPKHEWDDTSLRFENQDGSWGKFVDLKGDKGDSGLGGVSTQTSWSVTGNSGTTTSNFIGTTDNVPLVLKVNKQWAGFTGYQDKDNTSFGYLSMNPFGKGEANIALGVQALQYNDSGTGNVAIGRWALQWCTKDNNNVAVGTGAMSETESPGSYNVSVGYLALSHNKEEGNTAVGAESTLTNTDGSGLTAVGFKSLRNNTTGEFNTALGYQALLSNSTGLWNVALGSGSLQNNTEGRFNTAGGNSSMHFNATGFENTAYGEEALGGNLDGSYNTAVGCRSLWSVTNTDGSGDSGYGHGSANTGVGYESLWGMTTGSWNVAMGAKAMHDNSNGSNNIALGGNALSLNTTGNHNIAIGDNTLNKNINGNYNIAIGSEAGVSQDNLTNAIAIGYGAIATESNQVFIGNRNITSIRSYANLTTVSDARVKKNVQENVPGLNFINKLHPVTYNLDYDAINNMNKSDELQAGQSISAEPAISADQKNQLHTGFIAQEVEKAAESIGYDFGAIDKETGDNGLYGLKYSEFIAPLVKAVQELSDRIDAKDQTITALQERIKQLESVENATTTVHTHIDQ